MGKVIVFNFVTLNGFFKGPGEDVSWHPHDAEGSKYASEMLGSGGTLLFGRLTYEMMGGYWVSPEAKKNDPIVAEGMNRADKVVFSRTLKKAEWSNTRLMKSDPAEEVRKMKQMPGKDMAVLGSGSIVTQLADPGLIDEFQIMVDPVVLGNGTPLLKGLKQKLDLKLTGTRAFPSGVVLLSYEPAEKA